MANKMTMLWIATASLIHPNTSPTVLVTEKQIDQQFSLLFPGETYTPIMLRRHLVSWESRDYDKNNPSRGGSRNRHLFRADTTGLTPLKGGDFRLYKKSDGAHDGTDKIGPMRPSNLQIPAAFHHLATWYDAHYV